MGLVFVRGRSLLTPCPKTPNAAFDSSVLDLIEHSPIGAVPHTPSYVDALGRLYASHQVYADADHKGGHVTVRSLATRPCFQAANFEALLAGAIDADALEPNAKVYDRYVASLPAALRPRAESLRAMVIGKPAHHRAKHGASQPTCNVLRYVAPGEMDGVECEGAVCPCEDHRAARMLHPGGQADL